MRVLYPEIQPYKIDSLPVSPLHTVVYEEVGNPDGRPALFLHGGPGVGILPGYRRFFDPKFYRLILLDQRGAGRSTPHAELRENTTWDLVDDLEKLRRHCGVDRWVVMGGSWGSTLALSYAVTYPESVLGLILRGVFLGRPSEVAWLHRYGASEIWPDAWERFQGFIPVAERGDLVAAYYRRLTSADPSVSHAAARNWSQWEASTMCLIQDQAAIDEMAEGDSAVAIGRIECHYTHNSFFMKSDNYLLEQTPRIRATPCRIVQGRYDVICPVRSAWDSHRHLPASDLRIVPDGAHSPMEPGMTSELVQATEDFKKLYP
ncbi:MAG: prolyl aminopeptidase [candidate division Zixibacteria bacterium]|nr:prolyl aminopeptidase [candidate division Zixibacteria bacterium]